jgi:hypothetical protein
MASKITNEYGLRSKLVDLLLSKGYPEDSVSFDLKQNSYAYSLAIFDPKSKKLLAVFEFIVSSPVVVTSAHIREKIDKYAAFVSSPKVPLYIVSTVSGAENYSISKILYQTKNSDSPHFIEVKELLDFDTLKNNVLKTEDMSNDFSKMTDEELEGIIRLHENSNIPGSRFQRAMTELDLRYKKRGYKPGVHFEVGGDMAMEGSSINLAKDGEMTAKVKGNMISKKSKITQDESSKKTWFSMDNPIMWIIATLLVAGIIYLFSNYSSVFGSLMTNSNKQLSATSTINISDVLSRSNSMSTSLQREDFLAKYKDTQVQGSGKYTDISRFGDGYVLTLDISGNPVSCAFDQSLDKRLALFGKGDTVSFSGTFTGGNINGVSWFIQNCSLLN